MYAWLKQKGIGKEDFVLINLTRGVLPVVAIVGILKAGAAFALVEENYAPKECTTHADRHLLLYPK